MPLAGRGRGAGESVVLTGQMPEWEPWRCTLIAAVSPTLLLLAEEGKLYCEYKVPGVELLFEHARRAGIPVDRAEIVRFLEPSMFR